MRVALTSIAVASMLLLTLLVTLKVPHPYMDEEFHIGQAIEFGRNFFSAPTALNWDPAITTFPGLYIVSMLLVGPFLSYDIDLSSILLLRGVNAICMNSALFWLARRLSNSTTIAAQVVLFPLNFFFSFLYYTDLGSTVSVLACVLCFRERRFRLAGLLGAAAVLMRQTNIVWLFGLSLERVFEICSGNKLRIRSCLKSVMRDLWIQSCVGIGFVIFFISNHFSIVLGHHEHHGLSFHFAQINYFLIAALAVAEVRLPNWTTTILHSLPLTILLSLFSEIGTVVHPFLLADNRHYSFYFFKRIEPRWVRSGAIPALASAVAICMRWDAKKICMHFSTFAFCLAASLVPSPLLEFRYFALPCSMLLLSGSGARWRTAVFALTNILLGYVFLYRPFAAADGSVSRFMF